MKTILTLALSLSQLGLFAQSFVVTPQGLRDSADNNKYYVVLSMPGISAREMYNASIKQLIRNISGKERTVIAQVENEFIKYDTWDKGFLLVNNGRAKILFSAKYTIELSFKDGKVKVEPTLLLMNSDELGIPINFSGGLLDGYSIYDKKGNLKRPAIKTDLENYFNSVLKGLRYEINPPKTTDWQQ